MALEATHLRLALDLKDKYQVKDIKQYLSGAIYPDSRYLSGIDRVLTHPKEWDSWLTGDDDFKKGWAVHLIGDKLQHTVIREMLPAVFEEEKDNFPAAWAKHTAIKILTDIDDLKHFPIKDFLPSPEDARNPNGENLAVIKGYNQIFWRMYDNPDTVDVGGARRMWLDFGLDEELANSISAQAEAYSIDVSVMALIPKVYPEMLKRALEQ